MKERGKANLLITVHTLHLRNDNLLYPVLATQRSQILRLACDHGLISRQIVGCASIPMRADAVERVLAFGRRKELGHPKAALVDARLGLQGDGACTTRALVVAVAGAGSADFGVFRFFEIVDTALD